MSDSLCKTCGKELDKVTECAWTSCPKWMDEAQIDVVANGGEEV